MANRPNVQEILAAVRAARPAPPERESNSDTPAPSPGQEPPRTDPPSMASDSLAPTEGSDASAASVTPETPRPLTLQEKLAAARNRPATTSQDAPESAPVSVPDGPAAGGRPMSVKEKLAAARNRPAEEGPPPAPSPASESRSPESRLGKPATSETSGAGPSAPTSPSRPMSLQEKLAAARARPAIDSTRPVSEKPEEPSALVKTSDGHGERVERKPPPSEKLSEPHTLAESLRRSVVSRSVSTNRAATSGEGSVAALRASSPVIGLTALDQTRRKPRFGILATGGARWVLGIAALVVAVGCTGVLVARQLSSNARELIYVGLPLEFEPNSVVNVSTAAEPFWIVRSTTYDGLDTIYALRGTCLSAGEGVIWSEGTQTFQCPGSGSHYAISGLPIKGPGRRALERYRVALTESGQIVVDPSKEFREELGQWADPESFVRFSSGEASLW